MSSTSPILDRKRLLIAALPALIVPFLASLLYFVAIKEGVVARAIYAAAKVFILIWPLFACRYIIGGWPARFTMRPTAKGLLIGLVSGLLISGALLLRMVTPWGGVIFSSVDKIREKVVTLGIADHYIAFALFLSFIHSFMEEYYWRWFVFGTLVASLKSRQVAHLAAAVGFALHHIVVATQYFPLHYGLFFGSFVGIGGYIWSQIYDRQESLFPAWISHVVVDIVIMTTGYLLLFP